MSDHLSPLSPPLTSSSSSSSAPSLHVQPSWLSQKCAAVAKAAASAAVDKSTRFLFSLVSNALPLWDSVQQQSDVEQCMRIDFFQSVLASHLQSATSLIEKNFRAQSVISKVTALKAVGKCPNALMPPTALAVPTVAATTSKQRHDELAATYARGVCDILIDAQTVMQAANIVLINTTNKETAKQQLVNQIAEFEKNMRIYSSSTSTIDDELGVNSTTIIATFERLYDVLLKHVKSECNRQFTMEQQQRQAKAQALADAKFQAITTPAATIHKIIDDKINQRYNQHDGTATV